MFDYARGKSRNDHREVGLIKKAVAAKMALLQKRTKEARTKHPYDWGLIGARITGVFCE